MSYGSDMTDAERIDRLERELALTNRRLAKLYEAVHGCTIGADDEMGDAVRVDRFGRVFMPSTAQLEALETIDEGWNANLKIDHDGVRVWLARTGIDDGEPYEHTVYVELLDDERGWIDLGHYNGDDPVVGLPGVTAHALAGTY